MRENLTNDSGRKGSGGTRRILILGAAAALVVSGASVLWATPAAAGHDRDGIYCEVHRGHFAPGHYRRHAAGYVLADPAGYRFHTAPAYSRLPRAYYGRPALHVSGGYFYPQRIGYGPVYEPYGYLAVSGLRFGRTQLGFQIGLPAFPTVGVAYLGSSPVGVHHQWGDHRHRGHPHRHWDKARHRNKHRHCDFD